MLPEEQAVGQALQKAIEADRYDQTARWLLADWFDDHDMPEAADAQRAWTPRWQQAEDHVRDFCKRVNLNYLYFLTEAKRHLADGDEIDCTLDTSNASMDEDMEALWQNVGILLRLEVEAGRKTDPFTCGDNCFPDGLDWEGSDDR